MNKMPKSRRRSLTVLSLLFLFNLLIAGTFTVVEEQAYRWFDGTKYGNAIEIFAILLNVSGLGVLTVLCSWGPGRIWVRSLVFGGGVVFFCAFVQGVTVTQDSLIYGYYFDAEGMPLELASLIGNCLALLVPLSILLWIIAAIFRWRIAVPDQGPIQIRIVDLMLSTLMLAILFVANAEIQHRYYRVPEMDATGVDVEWSSVQEQRKETMLAAAVLAPIAAIVVTASAWAAYRWLARLVLLAVILMLMGIQLIMFDVATDVRDWEVLFGMLVGAFGCCGLIALNVRLVGWGGWPLSRRTFESLITHDESGNSPLGSSPKALELNGETRGNGDDKKGADTAILNSG